MEAWTAALSSHDGDRQGTISRRQMCRAIAFSPRSILSSLSLDKAAIDLRSAMAMSDSCSTSAMEAPIILISSSGPSSSSSSVSHFTIIGSAAARLHFIFNVVPAASVFGSSWTDWQRILAHTES